MKYAKSILLGGDIIFAQYCDHESSKKLSLVCPLCSSAVFYCSGSFREVTGKNGLTIFQNVSPSFHHYKTGLGDFDCENRATFSKTKSEINKQIVESKNQRLKLYNQRLWDLIAKDRNIRPKKLMKDINKLIKKDKLLNFSSILKKEWVTFHLSDSFHEIVALSNQSQSKEEVLKGLTEVHKYSKQNALEEWEVYCSYRSGFSWHYHNVICHEIYEFLDTLSSGFLWLKLTRFSFKIAVMTFKELFLNGDFKTQTRLLCYSVVNLIHGTHWVKIIAEELHQN